MHGPKSWTGLSCLLLALLGAQCKQHKTAATPPPAPPPPAEPAKPAPAPAFQEAFLKLTDKQRDAFARYYAEAKRLYAAKQIQETIIELDKAAAIFKDSPEVYNLRGSCHVEFRDFDKALECFQKADALGPHNPSVLFNIAEVNFVTHKWKEAGEQFVGVLKITPEKQVQLRRIVEFKILLCDIKTGAKEEVKTLAAKYDATDASPYFEYAQAAVACDAGNAAKAAEWLGKACTRFPKADDLAPWVDTLAEFGYIKAAAAAAPGGTP